MKRLAMMTLAAAAWAAASSAALAQTATLPTTNVRAVPTYESVGLYWAQPGSSAGCSVRFRENGATAWTQGLDLGYDGRDDECRGSLVMLKPNTGYQVEMGPLGGAMTRGIAFRTWNNQQVVARTIPVTASAGTLNVNQGGSASTGYVVYDGGGATLDAGNAAQYNVTINASYVIVRNLVLKGAQQDAIRIAPNVTDVIVEDMDISGWGRSRGNGWATDMDSGIKAVCSQPTLERVTIQRNRIHDPRHPANSWADGHPAGAQGITFSFCGGNHVIRHNEIWSSNGNRFNDGIGGEDNFTRSGFPNADTDIYGNRIANTWDDGIEAEGGNENVRIWGNFIDQTGIGIASTVVSIGPMYIWRNVWNRAQMYDGRPLDQDDRQNFMKAGSDAANGYGRRYLFHNTMLQPTQSGLAYPLGGGYGVGGAGIGIWNTVSKNNVWHTWKPNTAFYETRTGSTSERDLYNGTPGDMNIVDGINAVPQYAPGNGPGTSGMYQLAAGSPGHDQGVRIPNFNDGYAGSAPDVGAHESGSAAMKFGVAASSGPAIAAGGTLPSTGGVGGTGSTGSTGATGAIAMSTAALANFDAVKSQTVTFTNATGARVTFQQASMSSARYTQTNTCGDVAPGASCTATVTYNAGYTGSASGSLTVTSTAPNSPHVVSLSAANPATLVPHFYRAILRRAPDSPGLAFWTTEIARVASMGASPNEGYYAMAMSFLGSGEYKAFARDNAGYVADLYAAFMDRVPGAAESAYWAGVLAQGMPREVVLAQFMFSTEFAALVRNALGSTVVRPEADVAMDLYRGLLGRLPDTAGFNHVVSTLRAAQCAGATAVSATLENLTSGFVSGPEYAAARRGDSQYVGDLYNSMLRRGGEIAGVQYWIGQLQGGRENRDQLRRDFVTSPEFAARAQAVAAQSCLG